MDRFLREDNTAGQVERVLTEEYAVFARRISRLIAWLSLGVLALLTPLWIVTSRYDQIPKMYALLGPLLLGAGLFPVLEQRRRRRAARWLFVLSVAAVSVMMPLIMPATLAQAGIMGVIAVALDYLLLDDRTSRAVAVLVVLCFVANLSLSKLWTPPWSSPMSPPVEAAIAAFLGLLTCGLAAYIVRLAIAGQRHLLRRAHLAQLEIERRAAAEQEQRRQLLQANAEIEARIAAEQTHTADQARLVAQVARAADQLRQAVGQLLAAATAQSANVEEQVAAVTEAVVTLEETRTAADQTAASAQQVADAAAQSVETTRSGQESVADSIAGMDAVQQRVAAIAENILALSERTQQIGEIIDSVNDIADQSRLLALNASIEAARAGEEGRGFAVVAEEVRQLAEQSRQATARVRDILYEIQQATNTAVMVTEEGSKGAQVGMSLIRMAGQSIQHLADTIETSAQAAARIAASTQQQSGGLGQLLSAMTAIKQASVQTATSARQTEQTARQLADMARQLESARPDDFAAPHPAVDPTGIAIEL